VLAITSESSNMQGQLDLVWEHLLPAMKPEPVPLDPGAQARLRDNLAALALPLPEGQLTSATAARIGGKNFHLEENPLGLTGAAFTFGKHGCSVALREGETEHLINCGFEGWVRGDTALPSTPPRIIAGGAPAPGTDHPVAAMARWKDENTFVMTLRYVETPHQDTITCKFDGDKIEIAMVASIERAGKRPVLKGAIG
jgi:hypothetical protein